MEAILVALRKKLKLAADAEVTVEMIEAFTGEVATTDNTELANTITELTGEVVEAKETSAVLLSKVKGFKAAKVEDFNKMTAALAEVETLKTQNTAIAGEIGVLKADKATLEAKVTELTPKAALGDKVMLEKRAECERLYNVSVKNAPVEAVVSLIKKATLEELDGMIAQYTGNVTEKFTGKCKSCGSTDFEFKSSVGGDGGKVDEVEDAGNSFADIQKKFDKKGLNKIN